MVASGNPSLPNSSLILGFPEIQGACISLRAFMSRGREPRLNGAMHSKHECYMICQEYQLGGCELAGDGRSTLAGCLEARHHANALNQQPPQSPTGHHLTHTQTDKQRQCLRHTSLNSLQRHTSLRDVTHLTWIHLVALIKQTVPPEQGGCSRERGTPWSYISFAPSASLVPSIRMPCHYSQKERKQAPVRSYQFGRHPSVHLQPSPELP